MVTLIPIHPLFKGLRLVDVLIQVLYRFHIWLLQVLEEKIITFVKNELKALKEDLWPESSQVHKNRRREDEVVDGKEAGQRHADKDNFLKITLSFLRQMKQDQLADSLQRSKCCFVSKGHTTNTRL